MQKATIKTFQHDGKILQNRKDEKFRKQYSVLVKNDDVDQSCCLPEAMMKEIIAARFYYANGGSNYYCCIWIKSPTRKNRHSVYISGGGKAGGYGYHKASAALEAALNDAGISLSKSINGAGDYAMVEALDAVVKALGYKKFYIHEAHG